MAPWAPWAVVLGRRAPLPAQRQAGLREAAGAQGNSPSATHPDHIPRRCAGSRRQPRLEQGTQRARGCSAATKSLCTDPVCSFCTLPVPRHRGLFIGAGAEDKSAWSLNPRRLWRGGQHVPRVTWLALSDKCWQGSQQQRGCEPLAQGRWWWPCLHPTLGYISACL